MDGNRIVLIRADSLLRGSLESRAIAGREGIQPKHELLLARR